MKTVKIYRCKTLFEYDNTLDFDYEYYDEYLIEYHKNGNCVKIGHGGIFEVIKLAILWLFNLQSFDYNDNDNWIMSHYGNYYTYVLKFGDSHVNSIYSFDFMNYIPGKLPWWDFNKLNIVTKPTLSTIGILT